MKEIFSRYQFLVGSLLVALAVFFVSHKAPVMAPPAYAAAGDVHGSPNVTVAAFPVNTAPQGQAMVLSVLEIQADGSSKTLSLPTNMSLPTFSPIMTFDWGGD